MGPGSPSRVLRHLDVLRERRGLSACVLSVCSSPSSPHQDQLDLTAVLHNGARHRQDFRGIPYLADTRSCWHLETTSSSFHYLQRSPVCYGRHNPYIHSMHTYESVMDALGCFAREMFFSYYSDNLRTGRCQ